MNTSIATARLRRRLKPLQVAVVIEPAAVLKVRNAGAGGNEWADAYIREWRNGGSITIQSSYGNFANSWRATGSGPFSEFLGHLDYDYFFGKAAESRGYEFDGRKTIVSMHKDIAARQRGGEISGREAFHLHGVLRDSVSIGDAEGCRSSSEFFALFAVSDAFDAIYGGDGSAVPLGRSKDPQCVGFWREIWPHLIGAMKLRVAA